LLATILLLGVALRLGWAARQATDAASLDALPDQTEYLQIGRNLAAGRGLQFTDPRFNQQVWAYRTPGYPVFVAACGADITVIRIVQALLDASTAWAIYLVARTWLTPGWSLAAAALCAVDPLLIYFSSLILSETLYIAMLAWGLVLLLRGSGRAVAGAALLALAVLVRPSGMLLPVLLPLAAVPRHRLLMAMAGAGFTVMALLPWAMRNHARLGSWIWTSTNAGITRYDGFNPAASGGSDQSFVRSMPELAGMGEVERSDYLNRLAGQYIQDHPAQVVKLTALKIGRMWSPVPLSSQFSRPLYVGVALAYSLPLMVLAVLGIAGPSLPGRAKLLLLAPAVYFTIVHAASVSSLRYRLAAEPPLTVLAASAGAWAARKSSQ